MIKFACVKKGKLFLTTVFCFTLAVLLLAFGSTAVSGVKTGLLMCSNILIPSLFPFMVLCCFFCETKSAFWLSDKLKFLFPFGRYRNYCDVYLISLIGGYPAAACAVKILYKNREISRESANRLLLFAVNPSPAFAITAVGKGLLNSSKQGAIIYISCILSSFIMGIFICNSDRPSNSFICKREETKPKALSQSFVVATSEACESMMCICSTVVLFSGLLELVKFICPSNKADVLLNCITEVTSACLSSSKILPVYVLAAVVAFGGFCTGIQILAVASDCITKSGIFWLCRCIHAVLTGVIAFLIVNLFPNVQPAVSNGVEGIALPCSVSPIASLSLIITAFVFMCSLERNENREKQ